MAKPLTQSCITNLYHVNGFVYRIRWTEVSQHTSAIGQHGPVIELGGQCLSDLLRPSFSMVLVIYTACSAFVKYGFSGTTHMTSQLYSLSYTATYILSLHVTSIRPGWKKCQKI